MTVKKTWTILAVIAVIVLVILGIKMGLALTKMNFSSTGLPLRPGAFFQPY